VHFAVEFQQVRQTAGFILRFAELLSDFAQAGQHLLRALDEGLEYCGITFQIF